MGRGGGGGLQNIPAGGGWDAGVQEVTAEWGNAHFSYRRPLFHSLLRGVDRIGFRVETPRCLRIFDMCFALSDLDILLTDILLTEYAAITACIYKSLHITTNFNFVLSNNPKGINQSPK